MDPGQNITFLPPIALPIVPNNDSYDDHRGQFTPLVIDNGATTLRFGFATSPKPHIGTNVIAKFKERKNNRPLLLFADGIDAESGVRGQARTPWEGDVLLNFDALEHALDAAFIRLGIDAPSVEHPVLMTERLCSPLHSRTLTSELMFELYSAPSVAYCVDSIMSFYHNNNSTMTDAFTSDGLVISFNTASTSVVPVLNGKGIMSHAKRIPWGALQSAEYLLKLIQLKYPGFPTRVTSSQSTWMLHNFCEFAVDYPAHLRTLNDPLKIRGADRIIQFPYLIPTVDEKTEEELARIAERRREQGRKLQEIAAKTRTEKLLKKENDLQYFLYLRESRATESQQEWLTILEEKGFDDEAHLDETIKKLEYDLKRSKKKDADGEEQEEPSFPLVDVPDAELDEESLKEKKKQKLLKAGFDARLRAKKEKEREKEEREAEERKEEEERQTDLTAWVDKMRKQQEDLITKIKDRARRKAELNDRKSAASQARMKSIANLASDDRVPKKKRKTVGEDMFGANDSDWAIYRKINIAAPSSDEEEDLNQLQSVEQKLLTHDPNFTNQHTHASLISQRSALLSAFRPIYPEGDFAGASRIHLNVERWRVCEAWFWPGMAGVDSAGLGEVMQNVLARFPEPEKGRLAGNVFVTGLPTQLPGLIPKLRGSLRPVLPPEMPIKIASADDPSLDAWKGMADFAKTGELDKVSVTREEYEEWGGERIKRWWGGNWNASIVV